MECKNCGVDFDDHFCPNCGQGALANKRLTFKSTVSKFVEHEFGLHGGFFYTLKELITDPGAVGKNFIEGKRKRYTAPTRFLIIAVALQALVDYISETNKLKREFDYDFLPYVPEYLHEGMVYYNYILGTEFALSASILQIALFPVVFKLFFRKRNFNYTELLIVSFYYLASAALINLVISFFLRHVLRIDIPGELVTFNIMAVLVWSFLSFYKPEVPWKRFIKVLLALLFLIFIFVYLAPLSMAILFPV